MIPLLLLAMGTLASEDLTCIGAGLLVRRGQLHWSAAVGGCFFGIYLGDLGLWLMGRLMCQQAMRIDWLARRVPQAQLGALGSWFDRHTASSVFAARFLPGTRLPVYVAAGALGRKGARFAFWSLIAALIWTPVLVLLAASLGDSFAAPFRRFLGGGWLSVLAAGLFAILVLRVMTLLFSPIGRAKVSARIARIWRWEFWPAWLFYLPVAPWIAWLAIRYRGFTTLTAANPAIPHGGFVGESKFDILRGLKSPHVSPTAMISTGTLDERLAALQQLQWNFPLIFKPDAGQRGAAVKLIRSLDEARSYLADNTHAVVVQPYHPGPYEAGVFYHRIPGESCGRLFSITDKHFPVLIGDGHSTIEQLIWRHRRYRMQAQTFLARHTAQRERILAAGETFRLAMAGNHCQGTLFCDGAHLITPQLERAIDAVAQSLDGFYFGRFDIRYSDGESFKTGEDFTIIELNGVTAESTNLYDPSWPLWRAYRTLFRQWSLLFRIGAINRRRGHCPSRLTVLLRDTWRFYRTRQPPALAD